jgi:hypothetical protein
MTGVTAHSLDVDPYAPAIIETLVLNKMVARKPERTCLSRQGRNAAEGYLWVNCPTS